MPDKAKESKKNESAGKSSIEKLMEKYAAVEEDDAIRQTWNNNYDKRNGENRKKGNSKYTSYYYSPKELKNDTIPDARPKMAEAFGNAKSNFDSDSVLFSEIEISPVKEEPKETEEKPTAKKTTKKKAEAEEKPAAKKTTKKKAEAEEKPAAKKTTKKKAEAEEKPAAKKTTKKKAETEEKTAKKKTTRKKKEPEEVIKEVEEPEKTFQTNTRIVFEDKSVEDGISRHTEDEISKAFLTNSKKKKRFFRRRDK